MAGLDVLVVNAGSTSLKLSLVDPDDRSRALDSLDDAPAELEAVAHRIVHGGESFVEPVVVDDAVERGLVALTDLAPLHNAPALRALDEARRRFHDVPHVAVFDTAFHATIPEEARTYALPAAYRERDGIRRFGFHGLSVQWAAERVPVGRLVVVHLGGGCSVTAVRGGRSVDTTMGFTPLEGVPMATRSGSVDPGALLHLLRTGAVTPEGLDHALEHDSGLAGLSGVSGRVEELERSAEPAAELALRVFAYRVAAAVAGLTAALGGLDALVFTAGVGERSARVRSDVCSRLGHLGVELDAARNESAVPDADIAADAAAARVVVVEAREDVVAARAARALLA